MRIAGAAILILSTLAALPASAATVLYNFNSGLQGWTGEYGEAQYEDHGGVGGSGYLSIQDNTNSGAMFAASGIVVPANQLDKLGGVLSFSVRKGSDTTGDNIDIFGQVWLYNGSNYVFADGIGGTSRKFVWNDYSLSLASGSWTSGGNGATLSSVLSNLTSIRIYLENRSSGNNETVGLDNVSLTAVAAVPEPAEWATMVAGLGVVGWIARRRRARQR